MSKSCFDGRRMGLMRVSKTASPSTPNSGCDASDNSLSSRIDVDVLDDHLLVTAAAELGKRFDLLSH